MTRSKDTTIHIHSANQDPSIPDHGPDQCPKCKVDYEVGFGLAGGGYGGYTYCPKCGDMLSKTQERDNR